MRLILECHRRRTEVHNTGTVYNGGSMAAPISLVSSEVDSDDYHPRDWFSRERIYLFGVQISNSFNSLIIVNYECIVVQVAFNPRYYVLASACSNVFFWVPSDDE